MDDDVNIPLRLIETKDEEVIESIVYATNNQTPLKPEQLLALMKFSKRLEKFFQTYDMPNTLYYERRDGQYDRMSIEKTRIIIPADVIRSFASMFLAEPHRTTRSYGALRDKIGDEIFNEDHKLEPYYAAAYGFYKLEYLFRNNRLAAKYKPARFHILLVARLLVSSEKLPFMNSGKMEQRANEIIKALWLFNSDDTFIEASSIVDEIAGGNLNRDHIRRQPITDAILQRFGQNSALPYPDT